MVERAEVTMGQDCHEVVAAASKQIPRGTTLQEKMHDKCGDSRIAVRGQARGEPKSGHCWAGSLFEPSYWTALSMVNIHATWWLFAEVLEEEDPAQHSD